MKRHAPEWKQRLVNAPWIIFRRPWLVRSDRIYCIENSRYRMVELEKINRDRLVILRLCLFDFYSIENLFVSTKAKVFGDSLVFKFLSLLVYKSVIFVHNARTNNNLIFYALFV